MSFRDHRYNKSPTSLGSSCSHPAAAGSPVPPPVARARPAPPIPFPDPSLRRLPGRWPGRRASLFFLDGPTLLSSIAAVGDRPQRCSGWCRRRRYSSVWLRSGDPAAGEVAARLLGSGAAWWRGVVGGAPPAWIRALWAHLSPSGSAPGTASLSSARWGGGAAPIGSGDVNGVPVAARRRELYGPMRARPGMWAHRSGMLMLLRPVSYRH